MEVVCLSLDSSCWVAALQVLLTHATLAGTV